MISILWFVAGVIVGVLYYAFLYPYVRRLMAWAKDLFASAPRFPKE